MTGPISGPTESHPLRAAIESCDESTAVTDIEHVARLARELDTAIRAVARQMHLAWEALVALVEAAKAQNIHEALGFPSWTAYIADALDGQWRVERDKRGEVVKFLAEQGMSQRAIVKVNGIGKGTVYRELAGAPLGQVITGLDGKSYDRPEPRPESDEESDEEFVACLAARTSLTIPDTVAEMIARAEQIAEEEVWLRRIKFEMELAAIAAPDDSPAMRDAKEFGLRMRYLGKLARVAIEEGMSVEEFAEKSGCSVALIRDHLDYLDEVGYADEDES